MVHLLLPDLGQGVLARHSGIGELSLEVPDQPSLETIMVLPLVVFKSKKLPLIFVELCLHFYLKAKHVKEKLGSVVFLFCLSCGLLLHSIYS